MIIGIDLGTTNSLVSVFQRGQTQLIPNEFGEFLTPSVISIEKEYALVGKEAKHRLLTHPEVTVASFKRYMGTEKKFYLGDKVFTAIELSALLLRKLKEDAEEYLGEKVIEAIISVPAYFNDIQRSATKQAGELAGLVVHRIVNEPSAAALFFREASENKEEEQEFLIVDFGGGTLDVSVVSCFDELIEILAISGDNRLGGIDFDQGLAYYFCKELDLDWDRLSLQEQGELLNQAENCKIQLGNSNSAEMHLKIKEERCVLNISEETFYQISKPLLQRMLKVMQRVVNDAQIVVSKIVLVGGSSKMPIIAQYIKEKIKHIPLCIENPDFTIALGIGLVVGIKQRASEIKDIVLTDVCSFSLGTGIINKSSTYRSEDLIMSTIIERNTVLPCSKVEHFCTAHDNQKHILFTIYQGEAMYCSDNIKLDEIEIEVPEGPAGQEVVQVRYSYDINGILDVEIIDARGNVNNKLLISKACRLSDTEIKAAMEKLKGLKVSKVEEERHRILIYEAEKLYESIDGEKRQILRYVLGQFIKALEKGKTWDVRHTKKNLQDLIQEIVTSNNQPIESFIIMNEEEDWGE